MDPADGRLLAITQFDDGGQELGLVQRHGSAAVLPSDEGPPGPPQRSASNSTWRRTGSTSTTGSSAAAETGRAPISGRTDRPSRRCRRRARTGFSQEKSASRAPKLLFSPGLPPHLSSPASRCADPGTAPSRQRIGAACLSGGACRNTPAACRPGWPRSPFVPWELPSLAAGSAGRRRRSRRTLAQGRSHACI